MEPLPLRAETENFHNRLFDVISIFPLKQKVPGRSLLLWKGWAARSTTANMIPLIHETKHKIQSSNGPLNLNLRLVPKMLKALVHQIVPNAFVVSFKLETDPEILLVIGNLLSRRRTEVIFVTNSSLEEIKLKESDQNAGIEIEELIIKKLTVLHST
uniref:Uncharacterized protein n=1 Tax=Romanomermis culicivorax TaxID=13658 RepID=A0A915HWX3_ROMCU